ncbi:MAG: hypothetical protein MUC38_11895, partial [Cyclobacteriaceae bacterium]|nr:hypothetical protein [Cyclobacteriaceae bacterium]
MLPLILALWWLQSAAQVFPVQATTQLRPPYSLFLSDYAAPGSERLALNVFLVDAGRPELNVRFRLRIEGQGIRIETKPEFLPPPTSLTGGVPLQLISADLAPYFESRNLNFTGISQREYEQRGALPEGLYQFCFEVLEYNRGAKISNTSCAAAWLILNDPPIVNLPRDGEKVRIQEPQQVIFQWTPRHTGSPNSAFSTEYDFKMVEIWPPTRNPNDAILTSPPVFETTTNATTLIYGPAETPLEPGRRYAIQLKARSVTGVEELNLFKNNGLSQVYTFQYGDACNVPTNIVGEAPGPSRIALSWAGATNQTGYKVRYRPASPSPAERGSGLPAGQAGGEVWYTDNIFLTDHEIKSLQPNTRYEYQIAATCGTFESAWSTVASITTPDVEGIAYSCGLPMAPFNLDPSQLIDVIKVGDVIKAGDFDVKISKVTGSAGTFSGEGVIEVSYFNKAKVKAEFANIVVNKELRMVNGFMNVTGAGVDIIPAGVMDFMDKLDEALAQVDSLLNEYEANLPQQFDPASFVADTAIRVNGTITNVITDGSSNVVIVDSNGNRTTVPAGTSAAVTDSAGNGYIVDKKGNIHKTTAEIAAKAGNREYNLALKFDASPDQAFGFDVKHDPLAAKYERLEGDKYAPWKSVATGRTDAVLAILEGSGFDKSKIRFEQAGSPLTPNTSAPNSSTANAYELRVNGTSDGIEEGLLALYTPPDTTKKEQVLGKLNVATYDEIQKTVVIVPVNGNKYPYSEANLRTQLNKIYGQAVVKWNVQMAPEGFVVPGIDPFDDGGSGLLSNYSPDMRKVVDAYNTDPAPDTYYLFLVKNPKAGKLAGYMPRGKKFGFIFTDQAASEPAIIHTMAHELGHGAFNLRHTFAEEKYTIPQGSTDNLMDYTPTFGTKLYKHQWDQMRYPEIVMGLFEGDKDAAATAITNYFELEEEFYGEINIGITPNGQIIQKIDLPAEFTFLPIVGESTPFVVAGFTLYKNNEEIEKYLWDTGKKSYLNGTKGLPIVTGDRGKVKVYQLSGTRCSFRSFIIDWTSDEVDIYNKITNAVKNLEGSLGSVVNADISCYRSFVESIVQKDNSAGCNAEEEIRLGREKVQSALNTLKTKPDDFAGVVNSVCKSSLISLDYADIEESIKLIGLAESIKERNEIALLRLMSCINTKDYSKFYELLERNENQLIKNILRRIHDASIYPWDGNNYTGFTAGVIHMFSENPLSFTSRIDVSDEKILTQVLNLEPILVSSDIRELTAAFSYSSFEGVYNPSTGEITVNEVVTTVAGGGWGGSVSSRKIKMDDVPPLTPIVIRFEGALPIVKTALEGSSILEGNTYVVPAFFLKYNSDKERKEVLENTIVTAFDVGTIIISGGTALATKVHWARRIWALAETASAATNIMVTNQVIPPSSSLYQGSQIFDGVMLLIGAKNLGGGVIDFTRKLDPNVLKSFKENSSIKALVLAKYLDWSAALKSTGNLSDAERLLISKQEKVWNVLGVLGAGRSLEQVRVLLANCPDWVKANDALLESLRDVSDDFIKKVDDYYRNAIPSNTPSGFSGQGVYSGVGFNKYGHPELLPHVSSPDHIVKIDMKGNYTTDMTDAKNALQAKLPANERVVKSNPNGGWSPFYIEKNGIKSGP